MELFYVFIREEGEVSARCASRGVYFKVAAVGIGGNAGEWEHFGLSLDPAGDVVGFKVAEVENETVLEFSTADRAF